MSTLDAFISAFPCTNWGDYHSTCRGCTYKCQYAEPAIRVYRPHRRAVVQSLFQRAPGWSAIRFPRVVLQARLGCPDARAWVRHKRRHWFRNHGEYGWYPGHKGHSVRGNDADLPEHFLGVPVL